MHRNDDRMFLIGVVAVLAVIAGFAGGYAVRDRGFVFELKQEAH